jgi:hypothetical protein
MPSPVLPLLLLLGGGAALAFNRKPAVPPSAPVGSLDANLPPATAQQVAQALASGTDPNALESAAAALAAQGYPLAATALRAKAMMLRAAATQAAAMQNVQSVLAPGAMQQPGFTSSPGFVAPTPQETHATAQQVIQQAQATAASVPETTPAVTQAAQAASTATLAAATGNPQLATQAAQQAATAAATALSQPAAVQAAQAIQTAAQAAATGNPQLAQTAANQAVQAAHTALLATTAAANQVPAPSPAAPGDPQLVTLASAVRSEILAKGCWHEDRSKVVAYQVARGGTKSTPGHAGVADGMYGPAVALDMMQFIPKVPAPCYWPTKEPARSNAQKSWAALVKTGKVTVGSLGQNPIFVGALAARRSIHA